MVPEFPDHIEHWMDGIWGTEQVGRQGKILSALAIQQKSCYGMINMSVGYCHWVSMDLTIIPSHVLMKVPSEGIFKKNSLN